MKRIELLLFVLLGLLFLRYLTFRPHFDSSWIQYYNNKNCVLYGQVVKPPEIQGQKQKIIIGELKIKNVMAADRREEFPREAQAKDLSAYSEDLPLAGGMKELQGKILVSAPSYPRYQFGDVLRLTGEVKTPPKFENFSYKDYLAISGIYSLMDYPQIEKTDEKTQALFNNKSQVFRFFQNLVLKKVYALREKLESVVNQLLPEPQASLLAGIVFGFEREFEVDFYQLMQRVGVLHIIVASGFNIMVVVGFFLSLASFFGRKVTLFMATLGIIVYATLAGLDPPIVRAAILGGGAILANAFGKRQHTLLWLIYAAFLMLFINPFLIKSVSFQLSFLAAFALLVFEPRLRIFFTAVPEVFRETLSTTLSVQILTLPIIWANFREFSLVSLPVNTLVLGIIPFLMGMGALATFAGMISIQLGQVFAWPAWLLLEYFIKVVGFFGGL